MKTGARQRLIARTRNLHRIIRNFQHISFLVALVFLLVLGFGQLADAGPKAPAPRAASYGQAPKVNLTATATATATATLAAAATSPTVLVLYDSTGPEGWYGDMYRQLLTNLLSHFNVTVTSKKVESYTAGDIAANSATFYIGALYNNPLPAAFVSDFLASTQPVCWLGYNLWQAAWTTDPGTGDLIWNAAFSAKFGFQYFYNDNLDLWTKVTYKGQDLTRETPTSDTYFFPPDLGVVEILDPSLATVVATATCYGGMDPDTSPPTFVPYDPPGVSPYIIKAGNLWYVADNAMTYVTITDRYLALADLLYDVLGISYTQTYRAHVRIEDVSPEADPAQLTAIADYLFSQNVPFAVGVIPQYRDPLGTYNSGVAVSLNMNQAGATAVANALKYMVTRGGAIVQHGLTHQYDKTRNPYTGVTGDDYEFYKVSKDPTTLKPIYQGPLPGDSTRKATDQVNQGKKMLTNLKLTPIAWETPHYVASPADYAAFKALYPLSMDRGCYFSKDTAGVTHPLNQLTPYVIQKDVYGIKRFPENLGYISEGIDINNDPYGFTPEPVITVADMLAGARANLVVRDAWASFYYHPDMGLDRLQQLVTGVKALGYTFITTPVNGAIN